MTRKFISVGPTSVGAAWSFRRTQATGGSSVTMGTHTVNVGAGGLDGRRVTVLAAEVVVVSGLVEVEPERARWALSWYGLANGRSGGLACPITW